MSKVISFTKLIVVIVGFLITSCSNVKLSSDFVPERNSSQLIFRVHLDHDLNKQYDFERNGYFSFDLTLAKIVNGGIEEKVFLPNVRSGELYVLNLNPGRYSLVKGRFVINGWIERYDPNNITFEIKEGMLAYAGDIYIITKTFNNKSFGSLSSGATVHYNYIMKQYLRYNEETLLRFKEMYPELAKSRTVTLLSN